MKLFCAFVGVVGSPFPVSIDEGLSVGDLKKAIKADNEKGIQCDAAQLELYLGKKDEGRGPWLTQLDVLQGVSDPGGYKHLEYTDAELRDVGLESGDLGEVSRPERADGKGPVHVLVVAPSSTMTKIELLEDLQQEGVLQNVDEAVRQNMIDQAKKELEQYRRRGKVIREKCSEYCEEILEKIDGLFEAPRPLPFICVEGSSGMGKSQLAFALAGERPWFYWLASQVGVGSQNLYNNFSSVTSQFYAFVKEDLAPAGVMVRLEADALNSKSALYFKESLWTYGFIRALLKYCRVHYGAQMIHFEEKTTLHVSKCKVGDVYEACREMTREEKLLPFFILDEMTPNSNIAAGGKNMAAFQRNVFRACGLVVIVMGTDSKISNLVDQSQGSYYTEDKHQWMSVAPRFPPYQVVHHTTDDEEVWDKIVEQFPVLNYIVEGSRGRFSRYFVEEVLKYVAGRTTVKLRDLLDEAFGKVCLRTHKGKQFMSNDDGKYAQLMAISYTNAADSLPPTAAAVGAPPLKKRKTDVGTKSMHLHFANLVDTRLTDVFLASKQLVLDNEKQWKPLCCFPGMEEDLLLYLAILGGKSYSGYYDPQVQKAHSTKKVFLGYMEGKGFSVSENTDARSNNYKTFENMIAHAIFCASRRNGVAGILFDNFFGWLLGELQDDLTMVEMTHDSKSIVASKLFDGYKKNMLSMTIPFLTPPNAEWPRWILDLNTGFDCNFGHLVRARNDERCDVYVKGEERTPLLLCECKYWSRTVDIGTMRGIIKGLNEAWEWTFVLVFCVVSANFRVWEETKIGCVKIDSQNGRVEWKYQPEEGDREKLIIIVETGVIGSPAA